MRTSFYFFTALLTLSSFAGAEVRIPEAVGGRSSSAFLFKLGTMGEICTGFFISDDGHFATAAHCLDIGYQAKGRQNPTAAAMFSRDPDWKRYSSVERDMSVVFPGQRSLSVVKAKYVYLGKGYYDGPTPQDESAGGPSQDEIEIFQNDFAILKMNIPQGPAKPSCLPVADSKPARWTPVYTMSPVLAKYAGIDERVRLKSPGDPMGIGKGEAFYFGDCPVVTLKLFGQALPCDRTTSNVLMSTGPALESVSGSPIVNEEGLLVALTHIAMARTTNGLGALSGGIHARDIRTQMKLELGDAATSAAFNCK